MYLLDTCVLSEYRRRSPAAVAWMEAIDDSLLYFSVLTLGEITKGIETLLVRDPVRANSLRNWLAGIQVRYSDRLLPVDTDVVMTWGKLMARRPRPVIDALIAATALAHHKIIVTRNVADFEETGAEDHNPWSM